MSNILKQAQYGQAYANGYLSGWRNRIINGDMRFDQRNSGAAIVVNNSGIYTLDRWYAQSNAGAGVRTFNVQRSASAPLGYGFSNSLQVTVSNSGSPAAGDTIWLGQAIEGVNMADFMLGTAYAKQFTASFMAMASVAGTYSVFFFNAGTARSYVTTITIAQANTWQSFTITIPGDTGGTWATDTSAGLYFGIDLGSGANVTTNANAWTAGRYQRTSGAVSLIANAGATFNITGVQLEVGSAATPFERVDYSEMLRRCQRYYELLVPSSLGRAESTTTIDWFVTFAARKRASPAVTCVVPNHTYYAIGGGQVTSSNSSINSNLCGISGGLIAVTGYSATVGTLYGTSGSDIFAAAAEL